MVRDGITKRLNEGWTFIKDAKTWLRIWRTWDLETRIKSVIREASERFRNLIPKEEWLIKQWV